MSELRETMEAIQLFGIPRVFYWRFIYRHHMRHIHKRGKHQLEMRPLDGAMYCPWCGHLVASDGAVLVDGPAMKERVDRLAAESKRTGRLSPEAEGASASRPVEVANE